MSELDTYRDDKGKQALAYAHFPTRMQAVIWRNWGLVPVERIARVLQASDAQIREAAGLMGLTQEPDVDPMWLTRGYITIIRANWQLLPYEQLLELLAWSESQLAFALKEDDFLWIKLGSLKPAGEPVRYHPLTSGEKERTQIIRDYVAEHFPLSASSESAAAAQQDKPFGFLGKLRKTVSYDQAAIGKPGKGELFLDSSWTVDFPSGLRNCPAFVQRFIDGHQRKWGITLKTSDGSAPGSNTIRLQIVPDDSLLAESHRIEITPASITLTAVDEPGLLRGLLWLTRQMEQRGKPFLKLGPIRNKTKIDLRYIYSYFAVYGDPLIDPELDPYPEELLERLSEAGVNGIWLQSVLYNLIPWSEAPELSDGWEKRLEGLRKLVDRAALYGIGVYLYYNEPRAMPLDFFDKHPEWKGHTHSIYATLCTSHPDIQHYLRENTARLFREVPGLAGLFTITRSENLTNCYSHAAPGKTSCPRCSQRPIEEVIAEVNRCIAEGAFSVKPDARIICWTWGWSWSKEEIARCIALLPKGVRVMAVSEDRLPTNVAGVSGEVVDYSISNVGPSEKSMHTWAAAEASGLQSVAKVQFNNTWECSAVPFLPVFNLVQEHLMNLKRSGVSGLMLSWTLGGYPSMNLEIASDYYWESTDEEGNGSSEAEEQDNRARLTRKFGKKAGATIAGAASLFSSAFREFPFHIGVAYTAPQNAGPANLLWLEPSGYRATMVGFPYDDLEKWRAIYPEDKFASQFRKLSLQWKRGIERLGNAQPYLAPGSESDYSDMMNAALGAYYHFRSTYLQIAFVRCRNNRLNTKSATKQEAERLKLLAIVEEEIELAKQLFELSRRDSRIGYEASNHYYYTAQDLQEKVLNGLHIRDRLLGHKAAAAEVSS
ncbi:MAG: hypothetical protein K0Q59_3279 [Paenibacillus sp.]|nr:hypothetical protein [Paenibacillus sp.]